MTLNIAAALRRLRKETLASKTWDNDSEHVIYLLNKNRFRLAHDPRDKIYSLVGLIRDHRVVIDVDYRLGSLSVCLKFADSFIQHSRKITILMFAGEWGRNPILPTWVLDASGHRMMMNRERCRGNVHWGMRFVVTEDGFIGWVDPKAQAGDQIAILSGYTIPVVLRARDEGGRRFVG
ncbi:hypothetical protein G7Y89_g3465 [Cudoniella acicularis]|uniref:Uncharacterized protein n=1 Tax=Cudoniella acicularis TaxID=354080 RepID=A0A8H4W5Y3_9HELO|nr:hypothetical protein G7Y89_g3465 [Cudoniella acicularis]